VRLNLNLSGIYSYGEFALGTFDRVDFDSIDFVRIESVTHAALFQPNQQCIRRLQVICG
jgi:hypothetical protein